MLRAYLSCFDAVATLWVFVLLSLVCLTVLLQLLVRCYDFCFINTILNKHNSDIQGSLDAIYSPPDGVFLSVPRNWWLEMHLYS